MSSVLTRCSSSLATHCSLILSNARKIIHRNQSMLDNCGEFEYNYQRKQADKSEVVVYVDGCVWVYFCNICEFLTTQADYCKSSLIFIKYYNSYYLAFINMTVFFTRSRLQNHPHEGSIQ